MSEEPKIEHTDSSVLKELPDGTRVLSSYFEEGEEIVTSDRSAPGGDETGNAPEANAAASSAADAAGTGGETHKPSEVSEDAQQAGTAKTKSGGSDAKPGDENKTTSGSK